VSQERMDMARRVETALNTDEALDALLTPDFVTVNAATAVTDSTYEGVRGVAQWKTDIFAAFDVAATGRALLSVKVKPGPLAGLS
jgi:hypothetical protein